MTLFDNDFLDVNISFNVDLVDEKKEAQFIADSFGLGYQTQRFDIYKDFKLDITKQIYYITGDSGSGKSLLLKFIINHFKDDVLNFNDLIIDEEEQLYTITSDLNISLKYLTSIGLGDAFLFLNRYKNLSDGQKTRYKLLKCLLSNKKYIVIDEFLATLDRETAQVVSFNLQKLLRKEFLDKKVFVATTHVDLTNYIRADLEIIKRYGERVICNSHEWNKNNPFLDEITIELDKERGKKYWEETFALFHYRSHSIPFLIDIGILYFRKEPAGVVVYKHGSYKVNKKEQDLARISRVVILPKFRGCGLAYHFIRESNRLFFEKYSQFNEIDTVAIMANYNPFFVKAGMEEVNTFYPQDDGVKIKEYLDSKNINFFKFRINKHYALDCLDETLREMLKKLYIKKKRSYTSFNVERELPSIDEELEKFLAYLEVLQPKKYIQKR